MITATDITDAMQYGFSWSEESLSVAGYTIEIQHDKDAGNPYTDSEGNSPALWLDLDSREGLKEYGDSDLESFFWKMSPDWLSRHWRKLCDILDLSQTQHDVEARETAKNNRQHLSNARQECFAESLHDLRAETWGAGVDYLATLRALYRLAGIPAETYQRNGYSQGDTIHGLIVMTPEWAETVGAPHATMQTIDKAESDMAAQADEYGAWVFGDCYGYTITAPDGGEGDSCGGFIGSGPEKSGMLESLLSALNHHKAESDIAAAQTMAQDIAAARPDLAPIYA